jgi:5-amino-6-(5-phospho-D-ribitylamino)uracil phosphatase
MIYISDLDGTLLNDKAQLSEYSKNELNTLIENGLKFTVASARSVVSIKRVLNGLNLQLPIIEFNGAFITDFHEEKHLVINSIDADIVPELLVIIRNHSNEPFISTFNGYEDKLYYEKILNDGMKWYIHDRRRNFDKRLTSIENLYDHISENIVCFTVINKKKLLMDLYSELKSKFKNKIEILMMDNEYSSEWCWLTIQNSKAKKDMAIIDLLKMFNISSNDLVVFGDNLNDISMFLISKYSIAVENAAEEVKRIATQIIGSNNDDSVVKYIKDDFEKRSKK